jgi:hypothetical protein
MRGYGVLMAQIIMLLVALKEKALLIQAGLLPFMVLTQQDM